MTGTALEFFELVLKPCTRTYGSSPCAAVLGTTGDFKCYQSPATCQDPANFLPGEQLVRWAAPSSDLPLDVDVIPSLESLAIRPQKLNPGESLGVREGLAASFSNHPHNDVGFDHYLADRAFNPYTKGTFWPKFAARWPNLKGLECRAVRGFVGQALDDMERRYYVVDSTSGPDNKGNFSITAKDAISFLDGDKAQAPTLSAGLLDAAITDSATSLTLTPTGVGDDSYPAGGLASIADEVVSFTRSGDSVTLTARGLRGSKAVSHEAGSTFQIALVFDSLDPADIINTLLSDYTNTPADYLDYAAWSAETLANNGRLYSAEIMKPTSVKKLIDEVINQVGLVMWTDTAAKKIALQVLRNQPPLTAWNDDVFLKGTITGSLEQDARTDQVLFYYGQKNPLKKIDEDENYKAILNTLFSNAQVALEDAPPAIRKIYSRWITVDNRPAAEALTALLVGRYGKAPRTISFALPKSITPALGRIVTIQSRIFEDAQGDMAAPAPYLVTRVEPRIADYVVQAEQVNLPLLSGGDRVVYIDVSVYSIDLKTLHDAIYTEAESGDLVRFVIGAGVIIGSLAPSQYAATNTGWASGVDVTIEFAGGRIQGAGGKGGWEWNSTGWGGNAEAGDGGPAFFTDSAVTLVDPIIWGGGGGGSRGVAPYGGGRSWGGGGAGSVVGLSGSDGTNGEAGHGDGHLTYGGNGGKMNGTGGTDGGAGGDPGEPGVDAGAGTAGAAGNAITGVSLCTITGTDDILGPQVG